MILKKNMHKCLVIVVAADVAALLSPGTFVTTVMMQFKFIYIVNTNTQRVTLFPHLVNIVIVFFLFAVPSCPSIISNCQVWNKENTN